MKNNHYRSLTCSLCALLCLLATGGLSGCAAGFPSSGPSTGDIQNKAIPEGIQVIDITGAVAAKLLGSKDNTLFSGVFTTRPPSEYIIGKGDVLAISLWEAPPAMLFGSTLVSGSEASSAMPAPSTGTTVPDQMVDASGMISVPFAGRIRAAGCTLCRVEAEIKNRLNGMAHQPQVMVRLANNTTDRVTVVGEVNNYLRMPLTPNGERLLDSLAAAGGVKEPVGKIMIQLTRGTRVDAMPLDAIIRDPRQNIVLWPGDVITALYQPFSFTLLGATSNNAEITFEARGISLLQALARAGGLQDNRANPRGVFIFRLEPKTLFNWPRKPVLTTPDGRVPVVYRADLRDPATFFAARSFPIEDKDLLYVSNAPVAQLQKFLNIVMSVAYPSITAAQLLN